MENKVAKADAIGQSKSREFWLDDIPNIEMVSREINILLSKMHGRKRTEERMKISLAVRDRELRRKANKLGNVIQSVVGEEKSQLRHVLATNIPGKYYHDPNGDPPTPEQ